MGRNSTLRIVILGIACCSPLSNGYAVAAQGRAEAVQSLLAETGGRARVVPSQATGGVRLVQIPPGSLKLEARRPADKAREFLHRNPGLFGISDPMRELAVEAEEADARGFTHVSFSQVHEGVPVFGAMLRAHFDGELQLVAVNGQVVPGLAALSSTPTIARAAAEAAAVTMIRKETRKELRPVSSRLVVYRTGLIRGVQGKNHLAWEVEVGDGRVLRELVFMDAHDGRLLNRIDGTHEISRRVHADFFGNTVWNEGDPIPFTGSGSLSSDDVAEVNTLIDTAGEVYDFFRNLSGGSFRSYDGRDARMHSVQGSTGLDCPNAQWNGRITEFCFTMATDDIIGHEWVHGYTDATHDLIYEWQPGALNESYSDIFGEVVDLLNGSGGDSPGPLRTDGACSIFGGSPPPSLTVDAPASVAGAILAGGAAFNPVAPWTIGGRLELAVDTSLDPHDACSALSGFTAGNVAVVDRGSCPFRDKVQRAEIAGAVGVIVVNLDGDEVLTMGGSGSLMSIPSILIGKSDGDRLKEAIDQGVQVTVDAARSTDSSVRWLIGEDSDRALRDMWRPSCLGDPDRTDSGRYVCSEDDSGGVHTNSAVPNHAFALLMDGGDFNGASIAGIGMTRAVHIYWRAMTIYQVPTTGFADHADLLELSCSDLIGAALSDPVTGAVAAEVITPADCAQVTAALAAVAMRQEPAICRFEPLLAPDPPLLDGKVQVFFESFDADPGGRWTLSNEGVYPEYSARDWQWTSDVPDGGAGGAFFAIDSLFIGDCIPGSDDQSGVMYLESPEIRLPAGSASAVLVFDHFVATETDWDGGNLKLAIEDGPFTPVPSSAFLFNPYNDELTISSGSSVNSNPLKGEEAFTGSNGGGFEGSWGQSQVDLSGFVEGGGAMRLRFDFGVDGCNGNLGWYVDNVRILVDVDQRPRRGSGRVGG